MCFKGRCAKSFIIIRTFSVGILIFCTIFNCTTINQRDRILSFSSNYIAISRINNLGGSCRIR